MPLPTLPTAILESVVLERLLHFQLEFLKSIWMMHGSYQKFRFRMAVDVQNHSLA